MVIANRWSWMEVQSVAMHIQAAVRAAIKGDLLILTLLKYFQSALFQAVGILSPYHRQYLPVVCKISERELVLLCKGTTTANLISILKKFKHPFTKVKVDRTKFILTIT